MTERKRTKNEERHHTALLQEAEKLRRWQNLMLLEREFAIFKLKDAVIPTDWKKIEEEVPVRPKKIRVTAAFDEDLVKWFRAMGHNYQARMNTVLKVYMLGLKSREIPSLKDTDWKGEDI